LKPINVNQIKPVNVPATIPLKLFDANPMRKAFLIQNLGAYIVEVNANGQLLGQGVQIPVGGVLTDDHFNAQGELWIVSFTGVSDCRVWEVISMPQYGGGT